MYLTYRLNHRYVISEGLNHSDVFSINRNDFSCDYEIKTNKADLAREVREIKLARELLSETFPTWSGLGYVPKGNKLEKHFHYKSGKSFIDTSKSQYYKSSFTVPNKFCFIIPEGLLEYLSESIADTPYGIMTFRTDENYQWWGFASRKAAEFLHKEKATCEIKIRMLDRAVTELVHIRDKFYNHATS